MIRAAIEIASLAAIVSGVAIVLGAGFGLIALGVAGLLVSWRSR